MRRLLADWHVAATAAGELADPAALADAELRWYPAAVPTTAAGALRDARAWSWDDPRRFDAEDWWWRTTFDAPRSDPAATVLGFDGIATLWDAWLNGIHLASGDNMFVARELAVGDRLDASNELVIRCRALDPELAKKRPRPRWRVPMLEQQQLRWIRTTLLGRTPGWSPRAPAVGPWRPVWLESRTGSELGDLAIASRLVGDAGVVELVATLGSQIDSAAIVVGDASTPLARDGTSWRGRATIPHARKWWPHTHGEPATYPLALHVTSGGLRRAIELGATGFRTVELDRGAGDDFAFRVNGVPIFCRGACWTPLDVVTLGASPDAYRRAVAQVRDAGMNMIRIGGTMTYEDTALYTALDEAGVLLWQDLMFANMDYPDEPAFDASVVTEVDQQLARLAAHPCLAIVCGNSEVEQQAAMSGAPRERWSPARFHTLVPARLAERCPGIPYTPSSAHGGAFPHQPNTGVASYYGVGAYLRPLDDARRAEVRFASECLAFANIPDEAGLPLPGVRVHHPAWKARSPRDLGAGWDFDDVRDHYIARLYAIDPVALRVSDHERYLEIGRAATGEIMAQVLAEWRRARSPCRGALVWWLRDLWPGAGWGVVDAHGQAKPCWFAIRRALAPITLAISDEGCNGLAIHVINDRAAALAARVELVLYRAGQIEVGRGTLAVSVPGHGAIELPAAAVFDGFFDLSFAYRFGPPVAHVVHARLVGEADHELAETFWFPAGLPASREVDVGLRAQLTTPELVTVTTARFAQSVAIQLPGCIPTDNFFHLAPGQSRRIAIRETARAAARGTVTALNSEVSAPIERG